MPQNGDSLDVFVGLCMEFIEKIEKIISPLVSDTNRSNDRKAEEGSILSLHNRCLLRLQITIDFLKHFDHLYELCKPDFRKDSKASIALLELRGMLLSSAARALEFFVSAANPHKTLTMDTKTESGSQYRRNILSNMRAILGKPSAHDQKNTKGLCDIQPYVIQTLQV